MAKTLADNDSIDAALQTAIGLRMIAQANGDKQAERRAQETIDRLTKAAKKSKVGRLARLMSAASLLAFALILSTCGRTWTNGAGDICHEEAHKHVVCEVNRRAA